MQECKHPPLPPKNPHHSLTQNNVNSDQINYLWLIIAVTVREMFTLLVLVIQPNISHVPSHTLYSKLRHAVVNEEDLELCSFNLQLLWEPNGCFSEWHHINSAFDLFHHTFPNFGISAVRSLIYEEIDHSRLREVTSFCLWELHAMCEAQVKPNPFLKAPF